MRRNKKLTLFYFLTVATAVIAIAITGLLAYFHQNLIISGVSLGIIVFIFLAIVYPFFSILRKTGKELSDKNEEFRIIFNKSHDCIFGCNEKGCILEVNDRVEHVLRYKPEEIIGTRLFSHFVELPESKNITDLLNENFEITLIKKDGSYMPGKLLMSRCGKRVTAFIEETTLLKEAERDILDITRQYKESEERYDLAIRGSSVGIWEWRISEDKIFLSPTSKRILGLTNEETLENYNSFIEHIHPEDKDKVHEAVSGHLNYKASYDIDFRFRQSGGDYAWIHARGLALWNKEGKAYRMAGSIEDVSEQKQMIQDLQISHTRFQLATQGSSVGIWDWDLVKDYFYASDVCYHLLGFKRGELPEVFASFVSLLHPEDKERVIEAVTDHLKNRKVYDIKYRLLHKQGHYLWIHARGQAIWNNEGRAYRMAGSIDDITSQIISQKELEERESFLKHLHTVSCAYNLTLDEKINSLINLCHERFHMKFGTFGRCEDGRVVIQNAITPDDSLLPGDTFDQSNSFFAPIMEELKTIHINDIRQTKWEDLPCIKKRKINSYIGTPIFVDGKPYGALCFFHSSAKCVEVSKQQITSLNIVGTWIGMEISRKRYQKTLKEEKMKADEANRAKTEFLQNMSHEIRTPMNGIMGMTYLLMDTNMDDQQRKYASGVLSCSENLLAIIEDILDISRIETGKIGFYKAPFNLKELVFDTAKQTAAFARNQDIDFFLRYDPKAPEFFIEDQKRIRQVIANLLTNALKFTPSGYIYVNVQMTNETNDEATFKISVEDTGIGIPEDKRKIIFEKFQQVDLSSSRKYGGLGIGLSICKDLVSLMNGELGLKSQPNVGSTFWLTLPLKKDPKKPKEKIISHRMDGKTAYLITDSEILSRIITEKFEEFGIACLTTNNPQKLKSDKTAQPIDIIVVDELILNKELEKTIKDIQSLESLKETPFVLIEHNFAEVPSHSQNSWNAILTKPLLVDNLLNEADSLLHEKKKDKNTKQNRKAPPLFPKSRTPSIFSSSKTTRSASR